MCIFTPKCPFLHYRPPALKMHSNCTKRFFSAREIHFHALFCLPKPGKGVKSTFEKFRRLRRASLSSAYPQRRHMAISTLQAPQAGTGNCFPFVLTNYYLSDTLPSTSPDQRHNTPTHYAPYPDTTSARRPRPDLFSTSYENIHISPKTSPNPPYGNERASVLW